MSEIDYKKAREIVDNLHVFGAKPSLDRINFLLEKLGNPHKNLKCIHLAGTNGKGTTASYIASVLDSAGYKVGLYTSPYVIDFRERFKICGEMISEEEFTTLVKKIEKKVQDLSFVTQFEFITALAFMWFSEQNTDIVVLETGLGGRFDATNSVCDPLVSVITSISLDHTAVLGDTIEQIAGEKAGIVKKNGKLVLYPLQDDKAIEVVKETCEKNQSKFYFGNDKYEIINEDLTGYQVKFGEREIYVPFLGSHQILNAGTALKTIELLIEQGYKINDNAIKKGFKNTFIAARMEVISENPFVILDGGHNEGGAFVLKNLINAKLKNKKITAVIGMMADKDSKKYLEQVAPLFDEIITTKPDNPRALDAESLMEKAQDYCENVRSTSDVSEVIKLLETLKFETLIICGSLYLASEIRSEALEIFNNCK